MFKGLGGISNIGSMIKQAQQMGGRLKSLNAELKVKRTTGAAGGGLVEVDVNGLGEVLAVRIDQTLIDKGDKEMLEDLLPSAFNAAHEKAKQLHAEAMQSMTAGLNLPGLSEALSELSEPDPDEESEGPK